MKQFCAWLEKDEREAEGQENAEGTETNTARNYMKQVFWFGCWELVRCKVQRVRNRHMQLCNCKNRGEVVAICCTRW